LKDLKDWSSLLHTRESFATGLTIPFRRPAFVRPPSATEDEIQAEIKADSAQFKIKKRSLFSYSYFEQNDTSYNVFARGFMSWLLLNANSYDLQILTSRLSFIMFVSNCVCIM
jgi:hypothetical protein